MHEIIELFVHIAKICLMKISILIIKKYFVLGILFNEEDEQMAKDQL